VLEENHPISVLLTVPDVRAAVEHYTRVLGFELDQTFPPGSDWRWASVSLDRQTVMLGAPDLLAERCPEPAMGEIALDPRSARPGAGVTIYVQVPDVDGHHRRVAGAGGAVLHDPSTEFYGIRVFHARDPFGYTLAFYSPAEIARCESCGGTLPDESADGASFCERCVDDDGNLRPFDRVLEAVVESDYVSLLKMDRSRARRLAEERLRRQPAWSQVAH